MGQFITTSIAVFLITILVLVILLLVAKKYLSPSGKVTITINGDRQLTVDQGSSVMATLNENGVFLPSACGGKASCGQCKVQVVEGGGAEGEQSSARMNVLFMNVNDQEAAAIQSVVGRYGKLNRTACPQ